MSTESRTARNFAWLSFEGCLLRRPESCLANKQIIEVSLSQDVPEADFGSLCISFRMVSGS